MDSILTANSILNKNSWLFFRLYKNPSAPSDWKSNLDWYHQTLINVVKPVVLNTPEIRVAFFGFYGPEEYDVERERYKKQISPAPTSNLEYIRLRFSSRRGNKKKVEHALVNSINMNRNLVWKYEVMTTYNVRGDLGGRYGSNLDSQTLQFIRYWDAACRYILSILTFPGNWTLSVDVWGIPHMVNNSLGALLRPERDPVFCPRCQTHMYMSTSLIPLSPPRQISEVPNFLFICPRCYSTHLQPVNI